MVHKNYIVNLGVLIAVFVVGFFSLMGLHLYFDEFIEEKFDATIRNEQVRYRIGEHIIAHISAVESHYYKLATLGAQTGIERIRKDIFKETKAIRALLNVLQNGGSVEVQVGLNLPDIDAIKEVLTYQRADDKSLSMEFIDLIPKITSLETKVDELARFIEERESKSHTEKTEQEIVIFLKQLPTHFIRMKENAGRLLYESREEMLDVKHASEKEQRYYMILQYVIALLVMGLIVVLGAFLARGILRTNKNLLQSNEKAKALAIKAQMADHAKSQFLANMSHEIRTPLNGIIGFSNILTQSAITPQNREYARIIYENSHSLLDIINDILDLSKIEQGTIELVQEPFEPMDTIERIVELFAVKAKEKSIRFYFYASPTIPELLVGDAVRLRQVISNLLGNAIKFTPNEGKVNFEVRQRDITDESVTLRFSVQDSGIGIAKEQQKKVFEPFMQADEGISRKFGGTGLGLSISWDIVQKMGSHIELQSEVGQGSTFFFDVTLPIGECILHPSPKKFSHRFAIIGKPYEMPELLEVLQVYLHKWGHLQAWNPKSEVDALFCYTHTPGLEEILQAYKRRFPQTLVIGLSDDCLGQMPLCLEPWLDYFLECPLYGSKIFNAIVSLFKNEVLALDHEPEMEALHKHVLVAEDNPTNRHLMQVYLTKLGVTCTMAENGQEAVEYYQKEAFDAVLMDINMPIMDGIAATQAIVAYREQNSGTHVPIVALTANTLKGDKERYVAMGMDGHLSKPIDFNALKTFLEKLSTTQHEPTMPKSEPPLEEKMASRLDFDSIGQKMGLDAMTVEMIFNNFFLTLEDDLEDLEKACVSKDPEAITQKAHYLKGACANLFLEDVAELLSALEHDPMGKIETIVQIRHSLDALR